MLKDTAIIELFWARAEKAIEETALKYGSYCFSIAHCILHNEEDSEECVNDTYLKAWEAMPPKRPHRLAAYLGKITRNLSLDAYRRRYRGKRGSGEVPLVLDELAECVGTGDVVEEYLDCRYLVQVLNRYLDGLPYEKRQIFLLRYWYVWSHEEIAERTGKTDNHVSVLLYRMRGELKEHLLKEGIWL